METEKQFETTPTTDVGDSVVSPQKSNEVCLKIEGSENPIDTSDTDCETLKTCSNDMLSDETNESEDIDNLEKLREKEKSRELKLLLALSKSANLDTNISHKRKSIENMKYKKSPYRSNEDLKIEKVIKFPVTAENELCENEEEKIKTTFAFKKDNANLNKELTPLKQGKDMFCWRCHREGVNVCCELCPRSYHQKCLKQSISDEEHWPCPECVSILRAENTQTRSPAMKGMTLEHLCGLLKFALKRMIECQGSEPFQCEVNDNEFPDYKKYIVQPMNLNTLNKNIKENFYGSTQAFEADAKWILHNSIIFNSYQSKLTTVAKAITKVCKQEMSEIENCPSCYLNANTKKNSWFVEVCPKPHILVWAKLKGFPYWPAKVMCSNSSGMVDVRFFGAHDRAWVPSKECYLYCSKDPNSNKQKRNDIIECIKEVDIYISNLKEIFKEFVFAPFKMQYDTEQEEKQLLFCLPQYKPGMFERKLLLVNKKLDDGKRRRSRPRNLLNSDGFAEKDSKKDVKTSEKNESNSAICDNSFEKMEDNKEMSDNIENNTTADSIEENKIELEADDDTQISNTSTEHLSKSEVICNSDKISAACLKQLSEEKFMKKRSSSDHSIVSIKKSSRRNSDQSVKSDSSHISTLSDKISHVNIPENMEISLGSSSCMTESRQAPVQLNIENSEFSISPQNKVKITDRIIKKLNSSEDINTKQDDESVSKSSTDVLLEQYKNLVKEKNQQFQNVQYNISSNVSKISDEVTSNSESLAIDLNLDTTLTKVNPDEMISSSENISYDKITDIVNRNEINVISEESNNTLGENDISISVDENLKETNVFTKLNNILPNEVDGEEDFQLDPPTSELENECNTPPTSIDNSQQNNQPSKSNTSLNTEDKIFDIKESDCNSHILDRSLIGKDLEESSTNEILQSEPKESLLSHKVQESDSLNHLIKPVDEEMMVSETQIDETNIRNIIHSSLNDATMSKNQEVKDSKMEYAETVSKKTTLNKKSPGQPVTFKISMSNNSREQKNSPKAIDERFKGQYTVKIKNVAKHGSKPLSVKQKEMQMSRQQQLPPNISFQQAKKRTAGNAGLDEDTNSKFKIVPIQTILSKKFKDDDTTKKTEEAENIITEDMVCVEFKSEPESEDESQVENDYMEKKRKYLSALNISERREDEDTNLPKKKEIRTRSKTENRLKNIDNLSRVIDDVATNRRSINEGLLKGTLETKKKSACQKEDGRRLSSNGSANSLELGGLFVKSFANMGEKVPPLKLQKINGPVTSPTSVIARVQFNQEESAVKISQSEITSLTTMTKTTPSSQVIISSSTPELAESETSRVAVQSATPGNVLILQPLLSSNQQIAYSTSGLVLGSIIPTQGNVSQAVNSLQSVQLATTIQSKTPTVNVMQSQNYIPQSINNEEGVAEKTQNNNNNDSTDKSPIPTTNILNNFLSNEVPALIPIDIPANDIEMTSSAEISADLVNVDPEAENSNDFDYLNNVLPYRVSRVINELVSKPPPRLKPRPPGPTSQSFDTGNPSSAGPISTRINSISHRLSDYFRGMLVELLEDMGKTNDPESTIASLKLELETLKHKHTVEINELKKNMTTSIKDIERISAEHAASVREETRTSCEQETIRRIEETKSKQWCANCSKEAQFYCCWNTSYCDYPCQQKHWTKHMNKCTQHQGQPQPFQGMKHKGQTSMFFRAGSVARSLPTGKLIAKPTRVFLNSRGNLKAGVLKRVSGYCPNLQTSTGQVTLLDTNNIEYIANTSMNGKFISSSAVLTKVSRKPVSSATTSPSCSSQQVNHNQSLSNAKITDVRSLSNISNNLSEDSE